MEAIKQPVDLVSSTIKAEIQDLKTKQTSCKTAYGTQVPCTVIQIPQVHKMNVNLKWVNSKHKRKNWTKDEIALLESVFMKMEAEKGKVPTNSDIFIKLQSSIPDLTLRQVASRVKMLVMKHKPVLNTIPTIK